MMSVSDIIISVIHLTVSVFNIITSVSDNMASVLHIISSIVNIILSVTPHIIADAERKAG